MRFDVRVLMAIVFLSTTASAENWPGWRGPQGDGSSSETNIPTEWNFEKDGPSKNIVWRVPLDTATGHSSPIVWEDHVFLLGADTEHNARVLLSLDRKTGKERWRRTVLKAPLETIHRLNSYASSTPATDGNLVYVSFLEVDGRTVPAPNVGTPRPITPGEMVIAAYDFDGKLKWKVKPGSFISAHGFSSSPVLFEDLVIVNGDHDGPAYIVALNKHTGETVWKTERENGVRSYCTPLIREIDGQPQLMLSGSECVAGYDPRTGKRLWIVDGPTSQFVASVVMNEGLLFVTGGFPDKHMLTIDPTGTGNITDTHIRWHHERTGVAYVPSPVAVGPYFVIVSDNGIASCYDADTGKRLWLNRLGRRHSASAVTANGLAYFPDDDGITWVIRPDAKFELIAKNKLSEPLSASPAISQDQLFLRTENSLFCIGATP